MIRKINLALIALFLIGTTESQSLSKCRMLNGYEGECRYLDKCKPFFELNEKLVKTEMELLYLRQSTCGITTSYRYKVCCPPQSEWWRELQIDPVLFPELVDYMTDRVPNLGQNKKKVPGTTEKVGSTSTSIPSSWNTNKGQAQGAKRPPLYHQTAPNMNSYGFDDYAQKAGQTPFINPTTTSNLNVQGINNNQAQIAGQTFSNGQTAWNSNNVGSGNNQARRTERPPFQSEITTNINTNVFENDQSQRFGQTSSKGQTGFSEHPYKFESIPPQKLRPTSPNSPVIPTTTTQAQIIGQTSTDIQTDLNGNTDSIEINQTQEEQTTSNVQFTPTTNTQGSDNDQSQIIGETSPDDQIALSVNTDEFENGSSQVGQNSSSDNSQTTLNSQGLENCGVQAAVLNAGVVGGEAAPEQYPWLALLEYSGGVVNCGGSLISRNHVLTAAHCVDTMRGNPIAVRLSEYNMTTYPVDMAVTGNGEPRRISITVVPVEWSRKHPLFGHSHYQHDIGLVKMTRGVDYTDFVRPICLPQTDHTKRFDIKTKLLVAGWGTDSSKIEEVKIDSQENYVPIGICNRLVKRALNSKQMCAGERPSLRPCVGDYGGPLMLETDNAYVVVGVLSYGPNQCAGGSVPDVSTNVYEYLDWINKNMNDSSDPQSTEQT